MTVLQTEGHLTKVAPAMTGRAADGPALKTASANPAGITAAIQKELMPIKGRVNRPSVKRIFFLR